MEPQPVFLPDRFQENKCDTLMEERATDLPYSLYPALVSEVLARRNSLPWSGVEQCPSCSFSRTQRCPLCALVAIRLPLRAARHPGS